MERFELVLRALPSQYPTPIRLRQLLKSALRQYGFCAESIVELIDDDAARNQPVTRKDD
jgi:hypothetical protein